jgi:signal transduction histidine kinase
MLSSSQKKILLSVWLWSLTPILCSSLFATEPRTPMNQLYHTTWSGNVTGGAVFLITQTTDGYLWLSTAQGLIRFDGVTFERYKPDVGSYLSTIVSAFLATPDNGLWIGYAEGGAGFLKDGKLRNYDRKDGFPVGLVRNIVKDQDGAVWAAAPGGLVRLDGEIWHHDYKKWNYPGTSATTLFVDGSGTLWAATLDKIAFLRKGEMSFRDTGLQPHKVTTFVQSSDGTIWVVDEESDLTIPLSGPKAKPGLYGGNSSTHLCLFDREGSYWLGGGIDGIRRVDSSDRLTGLKLSGSPRSFEVFSEKQGLSNNFVRDIFEDREGNIWTGTDNGLDRFRHRNVSWYPAPPGERTFYLYASDHGEVWASQKQSSILLDHGSIFRVQDGTPVRGIPPGTRDVVRLQDGTEWFLTKTSLWQKQGKSFVEIALPQDALSKVVFSLTRDDSGNLWVSILGSGIYQLHHGVWKFYPILKNDDPRMTATYSFTDARGAIWLVYREKLARLDHGKIQEFSSKDGLDAGPIAQIVGLGNDLWVGGDRGLFLYQNGRFRSIAPADGSAFSQATNLLPRANDGLWLKTEQGIVHISEDEVRKAVGNEKYRVAYSLLDTVSDLPEPLSVGAVESTDGLLWFTTIHGFVRIDPAHIVEDKLPPPVSMKSLVADERAYSIFSKITLPALTKSLRIDYTALNLSIPERVRFRYKLEGYDKDWQEAGTRRVAFYTNLPPANYKFHVTASNTFGSWSETGADLNFVIAPAFYQTIWFALLCGVVAATILWLVYLLRLRQATAQVQLRFAERMEERERIARDLHDTLLQGFQGLMLHLQAVLKQMPGDTPARLKMEKVLTHADEVLLEGRQRVQNLRAESITAGGLSTELERCGKLMAQDRPIEFNVSVVGAPQKLNPIVSDEAFQIGREALSNAFRHSNATRIGVEIAYGPKSLNMTVWDNGDGIEPEICKNGRPGHWGLAGIRERARLISAQSSLWSEPGKGVKIVLVVPGAVAYMNRDEALAWDRIE